MEYLHSEIAATKLQLIASERRFENLFNFESNVMGFDINFQSF